MDSVTQIVLGAAVGEVCLGKKLGNRAMLWGAIAGTIPDLDVISNLWLSDLEGLAFHRGITHSLTFAVLAPFLLSWLVRKYYSSKINTRHTTQLLGSIGGQAVVVIGVAVLCVLGAIMGTFGLVATGILGLGIAFLISRKMWAQYYKHEPEVVGIPYWTWYNFFFWTIVTHPILDCFTVYGTQLFAPFADTRVSWDNIAVADPMYTVPFLASLVIAGFYKRSNRKRQIWVYAGLVISCSYMAFTFYNKSRVETILESSIAKLGITPIKSMTNPTILNNVLWSGTVETEDSYYQGLYSFFDKEKSFKLIQIPKNHDLITDSGNDNTLEILKWFSNQYYTFLRRKDGKLQFNDMRYGSFSGEGRSEDDFIFKFVIELDDTGKYQLVKSGGGPEPGKEKEIMQSLKSRIMGI